MNKKCVRFLDTLGSMAALIALVIGITSLFADKYDLSFLPEGFLKELVDAGAAFEKAVDPVARLACEFKNMIYKTQWSSPDYNNHIFFADRNGSTL